MLSAHGNSPQLASPAQLRKAKSRKFKVVALVGVLAVATQCVHKSNAAVFYDLAGDWSDVSNPNGPWSYNGVDRLPLPVHRADWDSQTRIEHFSSPQPAWSAEDVSRSVPMAFKSVGVTAGTIWNLDAPAGRVGMHSQPLFAGVTWTSPASGLATISGGVWKMRKNIGRIIDWHLTVNGSIVTGGTLTEVDPFTSSNPFDFANGSGGQSVLNIPVMPGDVIGVEAGYPVEPFHSDFVGVDFSISLEPFATAAFFWTDPGGIAAGTDVIKRANADGSGIQTVVSGLAEPRGMTLDRVNAKMYWADPGALAIRRANLDGSGPLETVVAADDGAGDVALDIANGKVYWTDSNNFQINHGGLNGRIRRANLDGSNAEDLVTGLRHPVGIALDPVHKKVYWTELESTPDGNGSIQRANLDGSSHEIILTGIDEANGLALDAVAGKIYWPELTTKRIQRSNLDGSGLEDVVTGLDNPTTIDLGQSEGKIYWTESLGQQPSRIARANFDGSSVEVLISGVGVPWGIAILPIPEPSSLVLIVIGCATIGSRRFTPRQPQNPPPAEYRPKRN